MLRLRPGIIAILMSILGSWTVGPASVALGADPRPRASEAAISPEERQYFEKQVRPLLIKHCYQCHSTEAKVLKGGLHLDSRGGLMKGGDTGPAIVPGNPDESLLIEVIRYESLEMPPKGKLADSDIAILERWVAMGAPAPRTEAAPAKPARPALDAGRTHWAFQP